MKYNLRNAANCFIQTYPASTYFTKTNYIILDENKYYINYDVFSLGSSQAKVYNHFRKLWRIIGGGGGGGKTLGARRPKWTGDKKETNFVKFQKGFLRKNLCVFLPSHLKSRGQKVMREKKQPPHHSMAACCVAATNIQRVICIYWVYTRAHVTNTWHQLFTQLKPYKPLLKLTYTLYFTLRTWIPTPDLFVVFSNVNVVFC